jgi:hypothetical protein
MNGVITGDVINSRYLSASDWLLPLKEALSQIGETPKSWEVYRGDSFQVKIDNPLQALREAILIKAALKTVRGIDVKMAIGIGEVTYNADQVTESNGPAFINSGELFSELQMKKRTLGIRTPWPEFDERFNVSINLGLIAMDRWTPSLAEIVHVQLEHETLNQVQIGELLGITQGSVSGALKRAHLNEIVQLLELFKTELTKQLSA